MCIHCKYFPDELQEIKKLDKHLLDTMETNLKLQNDTHTVARGTNTLVRDKRV